MHDDDHLDDVFTDLLGSRPVAIADEDATYRTVLRRAHRHVRRRRLAGTALATAVVASVGVTLAETRGHSAAVQVQGVPESTSSSTPPTVLTTTHGLLGLTVAGPGAKVTQAEPGLPAANAGINPGDRIVSVDGKRIASSAALSIMLVHSRPGDELQITWKDAHGQQHSAAVQLEAQP